MRVLLVILFATTMTGCIGLKPGSLGVDANIRGYNGRNAGETVGEMSMTGNNVTLVLPENMSPETAKALSAGLKNLYNMEMGAGEVRQDFTGGGIQAGESGKQGWLSGIFNKKDKGEEPKE